MDNSTEKSDRVAALEEEQRVVLKWFSNPVTVSILNDLAEQQNRFLDVILEQDITSMETFFNHFQACGNLRGLRRFKLLAEIQLEEIKEKLKEETQEE